MSNYNILSRPKHKFKHLPMNKLNTILSILLFTNSFSTSCQSNSENPDAWEAYHTSLQPPKKVMDAIDLKKGMFVGEIGAGRGRYAVILAKRVGNTGHIYANDIDKEDLDYLKLRSKRDGINNLSTILGKETTPLFPKNKLDMIFIVNTYHHISDPVKLLKNALAALKSNGRLVIVEGDPKKHKTSTWHSTTKEKLITEMNKAGYKIVKIETFLVEDNIYIFESNKE